MKLLGFNERPWLILCEGEGDKRCFEQLITVRGIPDEFQVRFPDRAGLRTGGRSKFGSWLAIQWLGAETFRKDVKGVLIISDNDSNAGASFEEVRRSLRDADGFPIPDSERVVARLEGRPPLVVMMIPSGQPGSLEILCLQAAYAKWPGIKAPIDAFVTATPINRWVEGKQAKARLQAVIASTCEGRPESGFVGHWHEDASYHLPLDHAAFDDIEQFLRRFGTLVG
jgi:hypothetical protein